MESSIGRFFAPINKKYPTSPDSVPGPVSYFQNLGRFHAISSRLLLRNATDIEMTANSGQIPAWTQGMPEQFLQTLLQQIINPFQLITFLFQPTNQLIQSVI